MLPSCGILMTNNSRNSFCLKDRPLKTYVVVISYYYVNMLSGETPKKVDIFKLTYSRL